MLVLSRKPGESVHIGDEVKVTVLSISGKQVRIGIEAPAEIAVHREEIYNKIVQAQSTEIVSDTNEKSQDQSSHTKQEIRQSLQT